jgi:serine/threonine protein kinase
VGVNELCKVGDFGMLRELPSDDSIYVSSSNIPCPIRWMPPEAISSRSFSVSSDVWSFGILLWEILNPGKIPYARMDNYQVISKINDGYRMPTPRGCPPMIGRIMKACWHIDPSKRPSFLAITSLLTTRMALSPTTEHHQSISYVT